jgi:hypothetical protein
MHCRGWVSRGRQISCAHSAAWRRHGPRPMFSTLSRSTNKFQVRKPPPPRNRRRAATAGARVTPVPHGTSHNARGHIIERTLNSTRLRGMDAMPATAKNTAPRTNERMKRHSHTQRGHTRVHTRHTPRATMGTCAACLPSRPRIQHQMSNGHGWVANPRGCGPAHDDSPGTTLLSSSFYTSAMLALFSIFTMRRCRTSWTTSGRAARAP